MKKPFIPTTEKTLQEYGVAQSSNIIGEATRRDMDVHRLARGYTYTTRDDGFPPTNLACEENPFQNQVYNAANILDFGCGVGRNLPWIAENTDAIYYGLDPNTVMLENFWKVIDQKYTNMAFLLKSFEDIPEGMFFDVVVSTFVMQHLGYHKTPEGAMNLTDMAKKIMKHTRKGTIWFLLEHTQEERGWLYQWLHENDIQPDVLTLNYRGLPELLDRGADAHLIIWRQNR